MRYYKFFKKERHRDEFAKQLRFGKLEIYKTIEDLAKIDPKEGEVQGKSEGMDVYGENSINPLFIYCLCDENIDIEAISKKHGRYAVQINNIDRLLKLLNNNKASGQIGKVRLVKVLYNRGEKIPIDSQLDIPYIEPGTQKAENFSAEHEWRFILCCNPTNNKKHIFIRNGQGLIKAVENQYIDIKEWG